MHKSELPFLETLCAHVTCAYRTCFVAEDTCAPFILVPGIRGSTATLEVVYGLLVAREPDWFLLRADIAAPLHHAKGGSVRGNVHAFFDSL